MKNKKATAKTQSLNHLKPIENILDFFELREIELINLLHSIPVKLEKLTAGVKQKQVKTLMQHKKAVAKLKAVKTKHAAKPSKITQAAEKKAKDVLLELEKLMSSHKEQHQALQMQLDTCKAMKKHLGVSSKVSLKQKTKKSVK